MVLASRRISICSLCLSCPKTGHRYQGGSGFIGQESTYLYALCRFLDRQGRFTGNLNPLQQRLLAYLLRCERDEEFTKAEQDLKNVVFANSPEMYFDMFEPTSVNEENIDWVQPQTEGDVEYMMQQLKAAGILSD